MAAWSLFLSSFFPSPSASAEPDRLTPAEFKAALLHKILPYVEWPENAAPLVVGVVGEDAVGELLEILVRGETVKGRPVVFKTFAEFSQVEGCQLLYIPDDQLEAWQQSREKVEVPGLLTVGDTPEFVRELGGMMSLSFDKRKLEVNLANAEARGLRINPKLLRIATVVKGEPKG